jgi:hypothetical protein
VSLVFMYLHKYLCDRHSSQQSRAFAALTAWCRGQRLSIWNRRSWVRNPARVQGLRNLYIVTIVCSVIGNGNKINQKNIYCVLSIFKVAWARLWSEPIFQK